MAFAGTYAISGKAEGIVVSTGENTELGKIAIQSILDESKINKNVVDEVIMGNVLPAGIGQAPARQAALYAGLPDKTECLTINKMCGSGLKAVMLADQAIKSGDANTIIAGGLAGLYYGIDSIQVEWIDQLARKNDVLDLVERFSNSIS